MRRGRLQARSRCLPSCIHAAALPATCLAFSQQAALPATLPAFLTMGCAISRDSAPHAQHPSQKRGDLVSNTSCTATWRHAPEQSPRASYSFSVTDPMCIPRLRTPVC